MPNMGKMNFWIESFKIGHTFPFVKSRVIHTN